MGANHAQKAQRARNQAAAMAKGEEAAKAKEKMEAAEPGSSKYLKLKAEYHDAAGAYAKARRKLRRKPRD